MWRPSGSATMVAIAAALSLGIPIVAEAPPAALDVAVKAAMLYHFAQFTEWSPLPASTSIVFCVAGADAIAASLVETIRGLKIGDHELDVRRTQDGATWPVCQLIFIAETETRRFSEGTNGIRTLPILTVSDSKGFSRAGGMIELFITDGRLRFAINVDATKRAKLQLSSRLLSLAKIVRDGDAP
jgi:YfiR/HmsC-like